MSRLGPLLAIPGFVLAAVFTVLEASGWGLPEVSRGSVTAIFQITSILGLVVVLLTMAWRVARGAAPGTPGVAPGEA